MEGSELGGGGGEVGVVSTAIQGLEQDSLSIGLLTRMVGEQNFFLRGQERSVEMWPTALRPALQQLKQACGQSQGRVRWWACCRHLNAWSAGANRAHDGSFWKAAAYIRMTQDMTAGALSDNWE